MAAEAEAAREARAKVKYPSAAYVPVRQYSRARAHGPIRLQAHIYPGTSEGMDGTLHLRKNVSQEN